MSDQSRRIINMILALLVATGAWVFVVYNYDPMTIITYSDVPITYTGLDTLADRGYAVAEANYDNIEVKLQQKRIQTGEITSDDIKVTADVSSLATGENTVALNAEGPDGTSVSSISLKTVTVDIESADSKEMEISFEYSDGAEENAEPVVIDASVAYATVIATEDKLAEIDRVAAILDPEDMGERAKPFTVELEALDSEGNKVINVVIEPETVSFKASEAYTKTVTLVPKVIDDSDDSYERSYTAPKSVTIKGSRDEIKNINSVETMPVNITYIYEDSEIPVEYDLPEGIFLANDMTEQVIKVTVTEKEEDSE